MNLAKNVWHKMHLLPSSVNSPIVFYDDSPPSVFSERYAPYMNPALYQNYNSAHPNAEYFKRFSHFLILENPHKKEGE
jgi:hypothetical protein